MSCKDLTTPWNPKVKLCLRDRVLWVCTANLLALDACLQIDIVYYSRVNVALYTFIMLQNLVSVNLQPECWVRYHSCVSVHLGSFSSQRVKVASASFPI